MPTLQILNKAPDFGEQLGQSLGSLLGGVAGGTLGKKLETHYTKKSNMKSGTALAQAIGRPELASVLGNLTSDQQKIVLKEYGAEALAENLGKMQGLSNEPAPIKGKSSEDLTREEAAPPSPKKGLISDTEFMELYRKTPASQKAAILKQRQSDVERFEKQKATGLKDTQKIRTEYANEAKAARKSLENKQRMLQLIEKGDLTNPIVAGVANWLPKGFRESLLTNDSLAYESALFDEFGVLKGMFPGAIRTAEINLLEPKLASLYKNDAAKKEIISVAMEAGRKAIHRGEAAAEVEKEMPELTAVQFEEEVERRVKEKDDALGEEIVSKMQAIANKYSDFEMMYDREGRIKKVNKDQVEKALNSGYKLAS